jgi:hypothetical protein
VPEPSTPPPEFKQAASFVTGAAVQSRLSQRTVDLEDAASTVKEYNPIRRETAAPSTEEETDSGMQQLAAKAEATNQRAEQALSAALAYAKQKRDDDGITEKDTKGLSMEARTAMLNNVRPCLLPPSLSTPHPMRSGNKVIGTVVSVAH